jgi:hypothetical protein
MGNLTISTDPAALREHSMAPPVSTDQVGGVKTTISPNCGWSGPSANSHPLYRTIVTAITAAVTVVILLVAGVDPRGMVRLD